MFDQAFILDLCDGNHDAVALIHGAWVLCEVWDDAVDGDKRKTAPEIHSAFNWALFDLPDNPLWQAHRDLRVALRVAIANWIAANELERSGDPEKVITAYTLRCSPFDFFAAVVMAAAGPSKATAAALYFRGTKTPDTIGAYLREHLGDAHGLGTINAEA